MDKRKEDILDAIIRSYINLPEPVGSRTISKDYNLGVSSATIRNDMADLEDLGYLNKPHASAGRIPSDKAYRFYVDNIGNSIVNKEEINKELQKLFFKDALNLDDLFRNAARLLAEITDCTAYVISSIKADTKIKCINLVALDEMTALLLIIGNKGVVEKEIISVDFYVNEEILFKISACLNEVLSGMDFDKVSSLKIRLNGEMTQYREFISEIIRRASIFNQRISEVKFYYDGLSNILNYEEYWDIEKAREFMNFVEDEDLVIKMLIDGVNDNGEGVEVIIGSENRDQIMKGNSIIRSTYKADSLGPGQIGIIGPMRMDYESHINTIKTFSDNLTVAIDKMVG